MDTDRQGARLGKGSDPADIISERLRVLYMDKGVDLPPWDPPLFWHLARGARCTRNRSCGKFHRLNSGVTALRTTSPKPTRIIRDLAVVNPPANRERPYFHIPEQPIWFTSTHFNYFVPRDAPVKVRTHIHTYIHTYRKHAGHDVPMFSLRSGARFSCISEGPGPDTGDQAHKTCHQRMALNLRLQFKGRGEARAGALSQDGDGRHLLGGTLSPLLVR
jgi:hypothetical protein